MSRALTRIPIIPLSYANKDSAAVLELLLDYENAKIYAKSSDGLTFVAFNKAADDHIANGDLHVTLDQKNKWTSDISTLFGDIQNINATNAPLDSPALTGTPTSPTIADPKSNSTQIANAEFVQSAISAGDVHAVEGRTIDDSQDGSSYLWTAAKVKAYVDALLSTNDAMVFKGTIGTGGSIAALPTSGYSAGWSYKIITPGTYAGKVGEFGDLIVSVKDHVEASASDDDWTIIQTNLDGAVINSDTIVASGDIPIFDGTSGKVIKTSGKRLPAGNVVGDTSYGTLTTGGSVKSSNSTNYVSIKEDGTMEVNTIDATKGGTGKNSIAVNSMLYASDANTYSEVVTTEFGRSILSALLDTVFTGLNADKVDDLHVSNTGLGVAWGFIPAVNATTGGMDVGKYIDFHETNADGLDYSFRFGPENGVLKCSGPFAITELELTQSLNINGQILIRYNEVDDNVEIVFPNI
jgi:hypothetical protein